MKGLSQSAREQLEELCLELRSVAVDDYRLPAGEGVVAHIKRVQELHAELTRQGVNIKDRIDRLSEECKWQMQVLLEDCLSFPDRLPFVRTADGIRRSLVCRSCDKAERPVDAKVFWYCNSCLRDVLAHVEHRIPRQGLFLFRTYTPEHRCAHADDDTVLVTDDDDDYNTGVCAICIAEELKRRAGA